MLVALNRTVQSHVAYIVRMEPGVWTPEETLTLGRGSCRDSAWLLVQLLRHLGYAARFVSGYLIQLVGDVKPLDGPEGPTPTSPTCMPGRGLSAGRRLGRPGRDLRTADRRGPHPARRHARSAVAAPITGVVETVRDRVRLRHARDARARDAARHQAVHRRAMAGHPRRGCSAVDRALAAGNVRLTMGGEPTFVSRRHRRRGMEHRALGPTKQRLAGGCSAAARALGAGSAAAFRPGKQYPGEQLPRWALACHWRKDGEPIWRDPHLSAQRTKPSTPRRRRPALRAAWPNGCRSIPLLDPGLRGHLLLPVARASPAGQRAGRRREAEGPDGARAAGARVRQGPRARRRLSAALRPRPNGRGRWQSGKWFLRSETCFLLPGDSPIGYRLPLDTLPWAAAQDTDFIAEPDPFAPHPALPPLDTFRRAPALRRQERGLPADTSGNGEARRETWRRALAPDLAPGSDRASGRHLVRTALVVEPRDGHLHVFFPPPNAPRTGSTSSPRSRTPPRNSAARWCWKATCRRAIRACCISRSRPIPA